LISGLSFGELMSRGGKARRNFRQLERVVSWHSLKLKKVCYGNFVRVAQRMQ
jgi:hypothetical protein